MDKKQLKIEKEREVRTYSSLWTASYFHLIKGQEDREGCFYHFMASLTFTAFTLEAYLNHIGIKVFKSWENLESLSPLSKLNIIAEKLEIDINFGRRPWQVMKNLFRFRNEIAHGKSEIIKVSKVMSERKHQKEEFNGFEPTSWEKFCTENNALKARKDVEEIVHSLYKAGNFEDDFPFTHGMETGSITLLKE